MNKYLVKSSMLLLMNLSLIQNVTAQLKFGITLNTEYQKIEFIPSVNSAYSRDISNIFGDVVNVSLELEKTLSSKSRAMFMLQIGRNIVDLNHNFGFIFHDFISYYDVQTNFVFTYELKSITFGAGPSIELIRNINLNGHNHLTSSDTLGLYFSATTKLNDFHIRLYYHSPLIMRDRKDRLSVFDQMESFGMGVGYNFKTW